MTGKDILKLVHTEIFDADKVELVPANNVQGDFVLSDGKISYFVMPESVILDNQGTQTEYYFNEKYNALLCR